PALAHHRPGAVQVDGGADGGRLVAEHDHPRRQLADRQQGVLEQRAAAQLRELLGAPEAAALARRQDEPADVQTPTSWMRPLACASRPPGRPWRMATISPMI